MAKFNSTVVMSIDGKELHFVTRGRSKPITMDEVDDYCKENDIWLAKDIAGVEDWAPVCSNKVFLGDLRQGLSHCSAKYGVSEKTIQAYIKKTMPHTNPNIYGADND